MGLETTKTTVTLGALDGERPESQTQKDPGPLHCTPQRHHGWTPATYEHDGSTVSEQ